MGRDMPGRREGTLPGWLVGSGVIAVAMGVMNLGTYGFTILAARLLGPVEYGALAAVMGLLLVVNVLSLGLQATAARRVSATPEHTAGIQAEILALSHRCAAVLGGLCLLASPLVAALLALDSWLTAALLAATVVPLTIMGGQAGVLQGERRWRPLASIYLATGLGRIAFGAVCLVWRPDALGAMTGVAVGAFLPALIGWLALRRSRDGRRHPVHRGPPGGLLRELAHNSHALLAFFALSNVDVVVARTVLPEHAAGLYAAGLILTKAVLFLPQFVVVVAFPSMAGETGSPRTRLRGLALVLGIGVVTTVGVLALSSLAVVFIGGDEYAELQSRLWAFAVLGTLLALLQLMVYDVVARQRRGTVLLVWAALVVVVLGASFADSVTQLLTLVAATDATLLGLLLLGSARSSRLPASNAASLS
jgi:O-antigen/teichoic acid export membrane protein